MCHTPDTSVTRHQMYVKLKSHNTIGGLQAGVRLMCLPAAHETVQTWIQGFGLSRMPFDDLDAACKELRLLIFPGTQVLQKQLLPPLPPPAVPTPQSDPVQPSQDAQLPSATRPGPVEAAQVSSIAGQQHPIGEDQHPRVSEDMSAKPVELQQPSTSHELAAVGQDQAVSVLQPGQTGMAEAAQPNVAAALQAMPAQLGQTLGAETEQASVTPATEQYDAAATVHLGEGQLVHASISDQMDLPVTVLQVTQVRNCIVTVRPTRSHLSSKRKHQ